MMDLHHFWYRWRSQFSGLPFNTFKLRMSIVFDFATSTAFGDACFPRDRPGVSSSLGCRLAYTARHLQLDQTVQFNRVLHWKFFRDRLNEAVDDQ
jgi:hypothetical protein